MIGKPEWFTYRIFGWGVMPRTKEGWLYILISMAIFGFIYILPLQNAVKIGLLGLLIFIIFIDVLHIMMQLPRYHDERQNFHQLIIERNVSFAAVSAIIAVALYQAYINRGSGAEIPFDASLAVVLGVMVSTKIVSSFYARKAM